MEERKTPIFLRIISLIVYLVFFWGNAVSVFDQYAIGNYKLAALSATACLLMASCIIKDVISYLLEDSDFFEKKDKKNLE